MEEMLREFIGEFREFKAEMREFKVETKNRLDTFSLQLDSITTRVEDFDLQKPSASQNNIEEQFFEVKNSLQSIAKEQMKQHQVIKLLSSRSIELEAAIQTKSRGAQD